MAVYYIIYCCCKIEIEIFKLYITIIYITFYYIHIIFILNLFKQWLSLNRVKDQIFVLMVLKYKFYYWNWEI